jgi:hypothetical protein
MVVSTDELTYGDAAKLLRWWLGAEPGGIARRL